LNNTTRVLKEAPVALRRHVLLSLALISLLLLPTAARGENPVFLGLYQWGDTDNLASTIANAEEFDTWIAPHRIALGGDFLNLETNPVLAVPQHLGAAAWDKGRIPFVKLLSFRTAAEIANGVIDDAIDKWGRSFALWSEGGKKRAFLAPLPEMNGDWIPYYGNPATVLQAYRRIRNRIRAELQAANVPQNAISWVFAPNGWSLPGDEFENFYPGHDEVDVVSFSGYNWGSCPQWEAWDTFETAFEPYLYRMRAMAPGKPIFIAETAVIDDISNPLGDRNEWLRDTYTRLGVFPALRGIVYFNLVLSTQANLPNCPDPDFRAHIPGTAQWHGFKDALADPQSRFGYWAPGSAEVADIVFAPTVPHVFDDVHPIHPFAVEPGDVDYSRWIHTLAASGVTTGCSTSPPLFCPTAGITRAQMAIFLLKSIHGASYTPPPATGTVFADVSDPTIYYAAWVEQLAASGITGGCGDGNYCPDNPVNRGQMAIFLLKSIHGFSYTPPLATGTVFADVPVTHPFAKWIEQVAREGITGGCGDGNFCPDAGITRQQMAVFLVRAFGLGP
jgi:S-layer homology domain